jgi:hypothetical protein
VKIKYTKPKLEEALLSITLILGAFLIYISQSTFHLTIGVLSVFFSSGFSFGTIDINKKGK